MGVLLTVPFHDPLKSVYVKQALKLIDQVEAKSEPTEDEQDDE